MMKPYKGNLELKKGNKIAAKRYHDLAAELDDGNLEFKVRQAIVLADLGQMSKAVEILKQARSEDRLCKHYRHRFKRIFVYVFISI